MRLRLDVAYDGTHFRGWAAQPGLRTVQGSLEQAVARIVGAQVGLVVAGRTDAGVHATGQVAHVDLDEAQTARLLAPRGGRPGAPSSAEALAHRVNGVLGDLRDVTVLRSVEAPEGFDARFSALWRRYEYRLADRVSGYDPLERHRTATARSSLDARVMDDAARTLTGLHDFAAFCRAREEATTIRTLQEFSWRRDGESGVLVAGVRADAFCHSMVRSLVGACVAVAEGRLAITELVRLRDDAERTSAFPVLAARGLSLREVGYPPDDLLAARAEQTRARRDAPTSSGPAASGPGRSA